MDGSADIEFKEGFHTVHENTRLMWANFSILDGSDTLLKTSMPGGWDAGPVMLDANVQADLKYRTQALTAGTYTYKLAAQRPPSLVNLGFIGPIVFGSSGGDGAADAAAGGPIFTLMEIRA